MTLLNALNMTSIDMKTADQLQRTPPKKSPSGNGQGAAAILAFSQDEPASPPGEVLGSSTVATTTPFPVASNVMPGADVHYNAPSFGGAAATQDSAPQDPPADAAAPLAPPTITFSNWRAIEDTQSCTIGLRYVDVSWSAVPSATYYEIYAKDALSATFDTYATTTDTAWPNLRLWTNNTIDPITLTVTAHIDGGSSVATTVQVDQALADQQPPTLLVDSMIPATHATGVPVTTSIQVPFNKPIKPSSVVNPYSIELNQMPDRTLVPTTHSLSPDGTTIILTPLEPLAYGTSYNLSISCEISDLYGNILPNGIAWFYDNLPPYFTTEGDPGVVPPQ